MNGMPLSSSCFIFILPRTTRTTIEASRQRINFPWSIMDIIKYPSLPINKPSPQLIATQTHVSVSSCSYLFLPCLLPNPIIETFLSQPWAWLTSFAMDPGFYSSLLLTNVCFTQKESQPHTPVAKLNHTSLPITHPTNQYHLPIFPLSLPVNEAVSFDKGKFLKENEKIWRRHSHNRQGRYTALHVSSWYPQRVSICFQPSASVSRVEDRHWCLRSPMKRDRRWGWDAFFSDAVIFVLGEIGLML